MNFDLVRRIHVPCADLRYPNDVRSESSDRHFIEKSDLATVYDTKAMQLQYKGLDLWPLIMKINLTLARSSRFPSVNVQVRAKTFLSYFLLRLKRLY